MPIYEYQCTRCGHRVEQIQRMDDPPLTVCEECGGELKKMVSAPAFQFKGTGWYVTDYGKGGVVPKTPASETSEAKSESTSADTKTETKAETKAETKSESKPESKSKKPAAATT
jgi:putative FmdB family regulatory protein